MVRPLLGGAAADLQDLALVQEQLAHAVFGVVLQVRVAVGTDAGADQEQLAVLELHVGVAEVEAALADGLHLRAEQPHAGLGAVEDLVVEERLAVGGDRALVRAPACADAHAGHSTTVLMLPRRVRERAPCASVNGSRRVIRREAHPGQRFSTACRSRPPVSKSRAPGVDGADHQAVAEDHVLVPAGRVHGSRACRRG